MIGSSFSAIEIASNLVDHASLVVNVINEPYWILPRFLPLNPENPKIRLPIDFVFYNRTSAYKNTDNGLDSLKTSNKNLNNFLSKICKDQNSIDELFIDPNSMNPPKVSISNDYINNVKNGKIQVKRVKIDNFKENSILFNDSTEEVTADAIIFCTGYKCSLDYFDENVLNRLEFEANDQLQPLLLYKATFCPNISNLAFVGMYRGPYWGVMELQARWASLVFSGKVNLPTKDVIQAGIDSEKAIRNQFPRMQFPHSAYVKFADSIASEIDALPDFASIKATNPSLYERLWSGFHIPAHYRLKDKPELALKAIEEIENEAKKQLLIVHE